MNDLEAIELEERILTEKQKKQRKHYLNPKSKAFINKFLKILKFREKN